MSVGRRLQSRIRELDPLRVDLAITGLFLAAWLLELTLSVDRGGGERLTTGLLGVLAIAPMALRRRAPLVPPLALVVVAICSETFTDSFLVNGSTVPPVAFLFELYSLGRYVEGRRLLLGGAVSIGGLVLALWLDAALTAGDVLGAGVLFGAPVLAGHAIRNRTRLSRELREKAERAERERVQRAREAIGRERSRIATELQAVVANGVSAMVVQAEAVPRLLAGGDTTQASRALAVIEETGRDALSEMRRLLGVLRRDGDDAELAPQPSLRRLESLVAACARDGLEVELEIAGERSELAPGVDLAAYRVLEQSLAAAREGGAPAARVLVRYGERDLELESYSAYGAALEPAEIAALRERVAIYGGHLGAGERQGGGFVLHARLPREAP